MQVVEPTVYAELRHKVDVCMNIHLFERPSSCAGNRAARRGRLRETIVAASQQGWLRLCLGEIDLEQRERVRHKMGMSKQCSPFTIAPMEPITLHM